MSITVRRDLRRNCPLCGTPIRAGDEINTNQRGRPLHTDCDTATYNQPTDDRALPSTTKRDNNKPHTYTVNGRRNTERHCAACHLIHAGACW